MKNIACRKKKFFLVGIIVFLMLMVSACSHDTTNYSEIGDDTHRGEQTGITTALTGIINTLNGDDTNQDPLEIGDSHGGGTIAYIFQSGDPGYVENEQHGLIVADPPATNENERARPWHNGSGVTSITATALGTGKANTDAIVALYPTEENAAKFCADYSVTVDSITYDDWFLPSKDELGKLYQTRVNYFENGLYWSSSENDSTTAWGLFFQDGSWYNTLKITPDRVRPVRYF